MARGEGGGDRWETWKASREASRSSRSAVSPSVRSSRKERRIAADSGACAAAPHRGNQAGSVECEIDGTVPSTEREREMLVPTSSHSNFS